MPKKFFFTFKNSLLSQNQSILKVLVMQKRAKQLQIKATVVEKCNTFILESKDCVNSLQFDRKSEVMDKLNFVLEALSDALPVADLKK
jgi:3-deoxy-D-arabino-heptulosonate 7-phosphate (DAHP) synthase class II